MLCVVFTELKNVRYDSADIMQHTKNQCLI